MSDLIVIGYDKPNTAQEVLDELNRLKKEYLIDLADACVVVHAPDGKVELHQSVPLVKIGAASGAATGMLWGALVGLLFLNPLAGMAVGGAAGAGMGALSGKMSDYGINDDFIRKLGQTLQPNSSALFVLVRKVTADRVLPDIAHFGGTVLQTSLSSEQEAKLKEALGEAVKAA
jgi:uncharacterized membrane protein